MIGFFGFSGTSRAASLKLLTVAASSASPSLPLLSRHVADFFSVAAGNDVHGYFASLTLCTFYGFVLLSALLLPLAALSLQPDLYPLRQ